MLTTFYSGVSSNLSLQKSPEAEIIGSKKIYGYDFLLFGSFVVINLKTPQTRKWSTGKS